MKQISTFTIIKNESEFVGYHIMSILDHVDEMVFADGNSTDGTIEIIEYIKEKYDKDNKIKLFKNQDCINLKDDYVRLFNWTIKQCEGKYLWFIHPDMLVTNPEIIKESLEGLRCSVKMTSIAGNRDKVITQGRDPRWATIYRNTLGLHYAGWYGSIEEDLYFSELTGDQHIFYKQLDYLPYAIKDTNINVIHFCDTKPYKRRLGRMVSCLKNIYTKFPEKDLVTISISHPRVTLQDGVFNGREFKFEPWTNDLTVFEKYKEFEGLRK